MGFIPKKKEISKTEWFSELERKWLDIRRPGYWNHLGDNCDQWASDITAGIYWRDVKQQVQSWKNEFRTLTGDSLLIERDLPDFVSKSVRNIKDKLYREGRKDEKYKNEVFDEGTPPIPKINDLVRTRIPCRYIDGVEFLTGKLYNQASVLSLNPERHREGRLEGYFAQHINFTADVFYRIGGQSIPATVKCEIQIATQLSTIIWDTNHLIYERYRNSYDNQEEWQWNPKDIRFIARQMGHTVHLVDGLLVQVRDTK